MVTISFPAVVAADSSEEVTYPICAVKCAVTGSPVCGERDGDYKLFINGCAKMSHYCNTGESMFSRSGRFAKAWVQCIGRDANISSVWP